MGTSTYFLSEKYSLGDNFPETSIYRSDPKGQSIIYETLQNDLSKSVISHEDPLIGFAKYNNCLIVFSELSFEYKTIKNDLAQKIYDGNDLLICKVRYNSNKDALSEEPTKFESKNNSVDKNLRELVMSAAWNESSDIIIKEDVLQLKAISKKVFQKYDKSFKVECVDINKKPVLVSAPFGKGKVYLLSDNYFLSNEYFFKNQDSVFLDKFFVNSQRSTIVFDQTMLGVWVSPGVMGLVRKYHFESVILGLFIIGLLLVWRLSVEEQFYGDSLSLNSNKEASDNYEDALGVLLKNNINPADLIQHACKELEGAHKQIYQISNSKLEEVKKISNQPFFKSNSEIVFVYNQIVKCIQIGKSK